MSKTTVLINSDTLKAALSRWEVNQRQSAYLSAVENFGLRETQGWDNDAWEEEVGFVPTEADESKWEYIDAERYELLELIMPAVVAGITNWTLGENA